MQLATHLKQILLRMGRKVKPVQVVKFRTPNRLMWIVFPLGIAYNYFMKRVPWLILILILCAGCVIGGKERVGAELAATGKENGILVKEVKAGSAAQKAGLQPGDIVVAYEGKRIEDPGFIEKDVEFSPIGRKVQMTILRAGKPTLLEMTIEKRRSRVVNVAPVGETPDYSMRVDDFLWIGSYPYPVSIEELQAQLKLLPSAIQDQDQRPIVPATFFTVPVR
jgi:membrane-associated protease RseP (regulator of RpoE activity)